MGINAARFPYFVSMDADSVLQDDALENIIKHVLADDTTVACGGMIRPANGSIFQKGRLVEFRFPNNKMCIRDRCGTY